MKKETISNPGYPAEVMIDSNLLLLLITGSCNERLIGKCKRLDMFTADDFLALRTYIKRFKVIRTTPHILTEVSNLAGCLKGQDKVVWCDYFARCIENFSEHHLPAIQLVENDAFPKFGITDSALYASASEILILTVDARLAAYLQSQQRQVENFNHFRASWLLS